MTLALVLVFVLGLTATVAAVDTMQRGAGRGAGMERGACREVGLQGMCFDFLRDADGNALSRDVVEANLNEAVANGVITAAQRDFLLERHELCAALADGRGQGVGRRCGRI